MAAKNWAYASLAEENSITLTLDGQKYEVVQFAANFAVNEIPTAQCMLAVGRNARTGAPAKINTSASSLRSMKPAQVTLKVEGDYKPDGTKWPNAEQTVFDGYFSGFSYVKSNGKVFIVAHLIHWLSDLGFTSTLNAVTHAPNPASLAFSAVMDPLIGGAGGVPEGAFITSLVGHKTVSSDITSDLWLALKKLFCGMANYEGFNPATPIPGVDINQLRKNMRARKALKAIEGPGGDCNFPYKYGKPLKFTIPAQQASLGISNAICHVMASEMVQHTLWDAMVGYYCPMFGLDIWPQVTRAVVAASLPGYRGDVWRTVTPDEYDFLDQTAEMPKPLRAVVVHGNMVMPGGVNFSDQARSGIPMFAGSYAPKPADQPGDGAVQYQQMPSWLSEIASYNRNAGDTTGNKNDNPHGHGEGGNPGDKTPGEMVRTASEMASKYAQSIYVQNVLRGRSGTFGGKLRLDIGPGSLLKLIGSPERFMGAEDQLAADMYAQVTRVTIEANAESRRCASAFALIHLRNDAENKDDRTSMAVHPFFGANVATGAPLVDAFEGL